MNKKNLFLSLMIGIFTLILLFNVQGASYLNSPSIKATLMSQDPDPVEPGQIVTVKFKIENEGIQSSQDVIVKFIPNFPFTLYGDTAEKNIGKLRADSTGADAEIVEFKLKVAETAVEEDAPLDLEVQIGEGAVRYTNGEFKLNIQTHDAVLAITHILSEPEQIAPGETAKVTIAVKNTADSMLKDIKFKLDMSSTTLPLAPYQSSSERLIPQLQSNYQQTLTFTLIAEPDATSGLYKVPINLTYNDEKGNAYSVNDILVMLIGETPKINAYIKKSTVLESGNAGKITLEVANSGSTDIKFLELELLSSEDYKLVSTRNYFYLGNIASDDTQSEEIDIYLNKGIETAKIPIKLKYVDGNNKAYQQNFDLEMNTYSSSELVNFGIKQNSNSWILILIIILAIGGFFGYRYYRKKKP